MKFKFILISLIILVTLYSCGCRDFTSNSFLSTETELMAAPGDTVYFILNDKYFKKIELNLKHHPEADPIFQVNFLLKKDWEEQNQYWIYLEEIWGFKNDSVYREATNNLTTIRRDQVKQDQIIDSEVLITLENRTVYFLLEKKIIIFLEEKKDCEYSAYTVGFGNLFYRPE